MTRAAKCTQQQNELATLELSQWLGETLQLQGNADEAQSLLQLNINLSANIYGETSLQVSICRCGGEVKLRKVKTETFDFWFIIRNLIETGC